MIARPLLGVLLGLWLATGAQAEWQPFVARVVSVLDGDTVIVEHAKKRITVRLAGIDAPERMQAWGDVARDALTGTLLRKDVRIMPLAMDDFGRMVAQVEYRGVNINQEQVRKGYAWEYSRYHADRNMVALQAEAKGARRGLWSQSQPLAPWVFRKEHPFPATKPGQVDTAITGCGKKQYCSQMQTCEEAQFYFAQCNLKTLDKDGDGTPCASLCSIKRK